MKKTIIVIAILLFTSFISGCGEDSYDSTGIALDAPANVEATAGNNSVKLTWDTVLGAESYTIYYSLTSEIDRSTSEKISGVYSPYIHESLESVETIYYVIEAVNSSTKTESLISNVVQATPAHLELIEDSENEANDSGFYTIMGAIKNRGEVSACDISVEASFLLDTGEQKTASVSIVGQTLELNGSTNNACLNPGKTGYYEIYTGELEDVVDKSTKNLKITVDANNVQEPLLKTRNFTINVTNPATKWEPFSVNIKNDHSMATAYAVYINMVTFDSERLKVTGVYRSAIDIGENTECRPQGRDAVLCLLPDKTFDFSIEPWRQLPLENPAELNSELTVSYLQEKDFQEQEL